MESAADLAQAHDFGVLGALKAARLKPSAILKRRASPKIKYNLFRSQLCLLVKLESAADLMQAYKFLKFWELQKRRRSLQLILCNPSNFWSSGSLRGNAFTVSPFFEKRAHLKIKLARSLKNAPVRRRAASKAPRTLKIRKLALISCRLNEESKLRPASVLLNFKVCPFFKKRAKSLDRFLKNAPDVRRAGSKFARTLKICRVALNQLQTPLSVKVET
ncbi:hypothetical protein KQX54_011060 [Cotesia glomerata]|uniref:Uncharacterized protein n=1 Tax=Cotesia glomerata TaxID=32391 RepID=A0AAV7HUX9_COTGL|nr:hypothetical protein KQX54_011060 [Cotesia glomerata]